MAMQAFGTAESYMNSLLDDFHKNANSRAKVVSGLDKILDNENYFHPFREGNGRTQREVIRVLGLSKGYDIEINLIMDDTLYHLYMDGMVHGELGLLESLFDKVLLEVKKIRYFVSC